MLPKHTTQECRLLKQEMGAEPTSEKIDVEDEEDASEYPKVDKVLNVIFADVESKRQLKVINREVNMAVLTTTKYLNWTKTPVTFDQSDHLTHIATLGRQALVVDPE